MMLKELEEQMSGICDHPHALLSEAQSGKRERVKLALTEV